MGTRLFGSIPAFLICAALVACGSSSDTATPLPEETAGLKWVGSWGSAPYGPYPLGPLNETEGTEQQPLPPTTFFAGNEARNQSFRMMVRPTLGGEVLRVRFSNLKGDRPLHIARANIALRRLPSSPAVLAPVELSFNGAADVLVPAGAEALSDAARLDFTVADDLAISFYLPDATGPMTWHAVSYATSFLGPQDGGDALDDAAGLSFSQMTTGWFYISGVDVLAPSDGGTVVAFGDSITDGTFSTPDGNDRWPDLLARRLQALGIPYGVLNEGINSNTVFSAGPANAGDTGVLRFERDVLSRPGVRAVLILLGTNDIGGANAAAEPVYDGLVQLAQRAQAAGLCVMVSTLLPRDDPPQPFGWDAATDGPQRVTLNRRLRENAAFDAVLDWARVMELAPESEIPNHALFVEGLHPNPLGFQVMADAIAIDDLLPPPWGRCAR